MNVIKQKEVFRSKKETNAIYEATCDGEPCYCLEHLPSGRMALFDRDRRVCNLLQCDINKGNAAVVYPNHGRCYFNISIRGRSVQLAKYMMCRYNKQSVYQIRNSKAIIDSITTNPTVYDLRRKNIYDTSRPIESTPSRRIWSDGSKIYIQLKKTDKPFVTDYDPALLGILQTPSLCTFYVHKKRKECAIHNERLFTNIKLHTFVYLYFTRFKNYRNPQDFLKHLDDERAALYNDNYSIDHFNGDIHNNCMWNLSRMTWQGNKKKFNRVSLFYLPYELYGAVDHRTGEYLVEAIHNDISNFYKCKSESELNDLLVVILGKCKLTEHTKVYFNGRQEQTPRDLLASNGNKPVERDFNTDRSHAEMLLRLNREQPEWFTLWNEIGSGIPVGALRSAGWEITKVEAANGR